MKGWGFPYEEWPQTLKDEYAYNPAAAKQLLSDAGYPKGFKTNVIADTGMDMDLLQIVKSYYAAVGIDMEIKPMDSVTFVALTNVHNYDVASRSSGSLGFTFEPLIQIQHFMTGFGANYNMANDPVYDAFYPAAMAATKVDDIKKIVKDTNKEVAQQHFCISLLQPMLYSVSQPWLKGYNGQNGSIYGASNGPIYLSFYGARFWIDQNIKKSMGH
jgi:peptide/nickel transport system substrate-binding protein